MDVWAIYIGVDILMEMQKVRFDFIDYAKVVAIAFIVIGHFLPSGNLWKIIMYSFHVPVFFVISGFLYHSRESFLHYGRKLARRVLLPYAVWFAVSALFVIKEEWGQLPQLFVMFQGRTLWNDPLWFLPVFFWNGCFLWCLDKMLHRVRKKMWCLISIASILFALAVVIDWCGMQQMLFGINLVIHLSGYSCIGMLMRQCYEVGKARTTQQAQRIRPSLFSLIVFCVGCAVAAMVNGQSAISVYHGDYNHILLYIPLAITLSISFIFLFYACPPRKEIRILATHTLIILCSHYFLRDGFRSIWPQAKSVICFVTGIVVISIYFLIILGYESYKERKR